MPYKSPAYRWYPNDVLNSGRVGAMSAEEECWYRRALDLAWINEGIPSDPIKLARFIGKGCTKAGARVVLKMFNKSNRRGIVIQDRQEEERAKQQEWSAKSSAGGKASAGKPKKPKEKPAEQGGSTKPTANRQPNRQPNGNIPFPFPFPFSDFDLKRLIDWLAAENPKKDSRLVEIAAIQTLINRNGDTKPINSAAYFADEIRHMCSKSSGIGTGMIDGILQKRRQQIAVKAVKV